jgi:hypothetical protein
LFQRGEALRRKALAARPVQRTYLGEVILWPPRKAAVQNTQIKRRAPIGDKGFKPASPRAAGVYRLFSAPGIPNEESAKEARRPFRAFLRYAGSLQLACQRAEQSAILLTYQKSGCYTWLRFLICCEGGKSIVSKKQFLMVCVLLFVIIALLLYIANQNNQLMKDFLNVSNYLSDKIDVLTTKVNMLKS